jgi:predicted DNA-binding protein with PD1-like motif
VNRGPAATPAGLGQNATGEESLPKHAAGQLKEIVYAHFDPGEDLLLGLRAVAAERQMQAGVILSVTGGLTQARFSSFPHPGPIETTAIEYFTVPGPLEASGHGVLGINAKDQTPYVHLHMTVANRQQTIMGHVEEGTIVRALISRSKFTVAMADVSGVRFEMHQEERPADARPFENWRDDCGWPVEPLYHVLEELDPGD